jgi:hypothetical protein
MDETMKCAIGDGAVVPYLTHHTPDRATNLPADTAAQPLLVWIKGFARAAAAAGEELAIETTTGRVVTGVLTDVNPGYTHTFGRPAPELTHVGRDLRARLAAYRASDAATPTAKAGE